jgi:hypothetical protein
MAIRKLRPPEETPRGSACVFYCCYSVGRDRRTAHRPFRSHCEESVLPFALIQHATARISRKTMIGATGQGVPGRSRATSARHLPSDRYFFFLAADFFAARKEIPARIAFC